MMNESELILNTDGSIYHLNLLPEDVAPTVITVGDPERVDAVSKYFDRIELKKGKREFITHTGYIGAKRVSVVSTGIGTDNIDIVMNELDALVNIDFRSRTVKPELVNLDIIRIGTSGAIQPDIDVGTILASAFAVGFDGLLPYYKLASSTSEERIQTEVERQFPAIGFRPYVAEASQSLLNRIGEYLPRGITMTAPGFYGPQGRRLRVENRFPDLLDLATQFRSDDHRMTNLEMETAGIYGMARLMGHHALSINAILANRTKGKFSAAPQQVIARTITYVLERL
jgi:uridine phosphorylase